MFVGAVLSMLLGMVLAWTQLAQPSGAALPNGIVAQVGERHILAEELQRAVNGANTTRRELLSNEQERQVLARLVDEQLLLQYGVDLGLAFDNPAVSKPLVQAVLGLVRANASNADVSDGELKAWYADNAERFAHGGKRQLNYYRVQQNQRSSQALAENANAVVAALRQQGGLTAAQLERWQVAKVDYLPSSLMPANKLRDYLGPSLVSAALALTEPGVAEPLPINNGVAVLQVLAVELAGQPQYEAVKSEVQQAYLRDQGERALRDLLDQLREDYPVTLSSDWQ